MTIHQNTRRITMPKNFRAYAAAFALMTSAVSCDTDVVNPGPVADSDLDRNAATALVNGSGRALAQAINWISYTGAAVTREIHPAGSTGSFGITSRWQQGELAADDEDLNTHWEQATRARWLAEESVRRLVAVGPPGPNEVQTATAYANALRQAHVWAGFANRLMAENMCDAVIDGGPLQAGVTEYLTRAEDAFTAALAVTGGTAATTTALNAAATAGRASVRMYQGDWANAVVDATTIPSTMSYAVSYFSVGDDAQRNRVAYASGNTRESGSAYRAHTQWMTWHLEYKYGSQTTLDATSVPVMDDPRILIATSTQALGDAAIECCGRVPFYPQDKHRLSTAPIRLTSGREMLLIRAENELVTNSNGAAALALIDQARTAGGAPTITASWDGTLADAWRLLKRERGIELWLEARRLGDRRRWVQDGRPGALHALELPDATYPGNTSHLNPSLHNPAVAGTFCFPVSRSERNTNPNIPDA